MAHRDISSKELDDLFDAVLALESREECYAFFQDVCTIPELKALSLRLKVAKQLYLTDDTYDKITAECGVSTATVSRVRNSLLYGTGGYKMIIDRVVPPDESEQ